MAVKAATAVLIGMGALACGLAAPRAAAQTSCAALGQIEAFVRQADQPRRPPDAREAANLSGALEQALGAGQLNGAERRAFGVYLDRLTQGIAPGPPPIGPQEVARRHLLCLATVAAQAPAPATGLTQAQNRARHGLPDALPQASPSRSAAPEVSQNKDDPRWQALLPQLRFLLGVVLAGLLVALIWTRLQRLRKIRLRQARRFICNLPALFATGASSHLGFIVDISALGCKLETRGQVLEDGAHVRLMLPGKMMEGKVVWATHTHVGLVFYHRLAREELRALLKGPRHLPMGLPA